MKNKLLKPVLFGVYFCLATVLCQAQLVMEQASPVYVVLNGGVAAKPIYLVIGTATPSGITTLGRPSATANGGIISEAEFNMVQWNIGATAAGNTYTIPFQYQSAANTNENYIPVTFINYGAGVGAGGNIKFSTYHGNSSTAHGCTGGGAGNYSDNLCYMPSDVTNMDPATSTSSPSATDDSYYVVDRFWIADANTGYTTKPDPEFTFTYLSTGNTESEVVTGGANQNQAIDNTLIGQRFNSGSGTWGDYYGQTGTTSASSSIDTKTVTVGGAVKDVTAAGFYRSWTLSDANAPLPIELTSFTAQCQNYYALLQWTTATETNNDYFTIDRTQDGVHFETVAVVKGAGTTSVPHSYSAIDYSPLTGVSYYRLTQTDLNGVVNFPNDGTIAFTPCENEESINAYTISNSIINVQINAVTTGNYTITLMNTLGQVIFTENKAASVGLNDYKLNTQVARGIYILQIEGTEKVYSKKIYLGAL